MERRSWALAIVFVLTGCPVDDRALSPGDEPVIQFVTGGTDAGGTAGESAASPGAGDSATAATDAGGGDAGGRGGSSRGGQGGGSAGAPRGGSSGDGGTDPNGVGTAGVDTSGPCEGEGCSCEGLDERACARQSCCTSLTLPAGTFTLGEADASVAPFRLDEFEVTVGRFRRYVASYLRPPAPDAGEHDYVIGSGWLPEWSAQMPDDRAGLVARLRCDGQTWTDAVGDGESLPMNCVNWYEAFAFCAWDGGRLPTEAEWEYAAAGGDEARPYPWGDEAPDASAAVYACSLGSECTGSLAPVGSKPHGAARYGQLDLAGSLAEWTLDYFAPYPAHCDHCANIGDGSERVARGGDLTSSESALGSTVRAAFDPEARDFTRGFRCARRP